MAKEGGRALLRLPSGEVRYVRDNCRATVGQVGNVEYANEVIGKAGRKRHMGIRPTVRGSVMNPNDHPHGGGEGRSPIGRPSDRKSTTSELQSRQYLVCRLLLEKKKILTLYTRLQHLSHKQ